MRVALLALVALVAAPAQAQDRIDTKAGPLRVETVAKGLEHPWGLAFLPEGGMLVTERPGRLRRVGPDGSLSEPLKGVPRVAAQGQGGLLDVALDPNFAQNRLVYLSYAEPRGNGAATAAGRGRLSKDGNALEDFKPVFRQEPAVSGGRHFGSRLAFTPDGKLFVSTGDRGQETPSQDLDSLIGKLIRINPDGSIPADNPFVGYANARDEIWSWGHRNIQGLAVQPGTGTLWSLEFGPRGGDALTIPQAGENYGWPEVSYGTQYDGKPIPDPPTRPEFAQPVRHWTPAISPSGMTFYSGRAIPAWKGDLLIAGLTFHGLVRLSIDGRRVTGEERISLGARIRAVREGPDGAVYVLTDRSNGEIRRLTPAERG
jgi:aldose sugar dehydrogenase